MKYRSEIIIDLPREQVIALFENRENLQKWQRGLKRVEHISGEPGQPGARTRLVVEEAGRTIDMTETVLTRNLPDEYSGRYEASGVHNVVVNRFIAEGDKTRWVMDNEFAFSGFMQALAPLIGGIFRQRTQSDMQRFKEFAEGTIR